MPLPDVLYLRHDGGAAIGPLPRRDFEVLYDSRVVDERTPISEDGTDYAPLRERPELLARVLEVKELLGLGEDPWADSDDLPSGPSEIADEDTPVLRILLEAAANKGTGHLVLAGHEGDVRIIFKDGNIASLETSIEALSLEGYLLDEGICDAAAIATAQERAPAMGGDLGAALIATGAVQPHEWFEKLVSWAHGVLVGAVTEHFSERRFEAADVPPPAVPLGMDRLGITLEIVRRLDSSVLTGYLDDRLPCPVIPSQVDGVKLEETKPKPRELRVLKAIDGVKTVQELLDALGGSGDKKLPVQHALFFAAETGFAVFGDDPLFKKEREEATALLERYARMSKQHLFDILGVNERSSDDEVRAHYTDYAKQFHPDTLRARAAPELLEARRKVFGLISEAFEALETEDQRYKYAHDLEQGIAGGTDDLQRVQDTLQSETLFKKSEILLRVRKYAEARIHIDEAIKLNPDDLEFQIFRAYVIYLEAAKAGDAVPAATAAIKRILALMKNNANIASGYLYLGHLNKTVDKAEVAVKYFEKVLEYDENHPEAIREVRIARLRAEKKKKKKRWSL